jgi:hypothetical protein
MRPSSTGIVTGTNYRFVNLLGKFGVKSSNGFFWTFAHAGLTGNVAYTLPNASGTFALSVAGLTPSSVGAITTTTVGTSLFNLVNPGAITFIRINADNSVTTQSAANFKTSLSLNNVENTALSTWAGSTNLTIIGTIATGIWQGTIIAKAFLPATVVHTDQANTYTAGTKQTFGASASTAGFNLAGVAADPSSLAAGDIWRRTDSIGIKMYDGTKAYWMNYVSGETTYAGTDTWDGTAPSSSLSKVYKWSQNYKTVHLEIYISYNVAGVTNTTATLTFPSGVPLPATVTGFTANNSSIVPVSGWLGSGPTNNQGGSAKAAITLDGSGNPIISLTGGSSLSGKVARVSLTYFTN